MRFEAASTLPEAEQDALAATIPEEVVAGAAAALLTTRRAAFLSRHNLK